VFAKGIYLLVLDVPEVELRVGSLGRLKFCGWYAYVGSNQAGGRIKRHLQKGKEPKWHIDHLTEAGDVRMVVTLPLSKHYEEELARWLARDFEVVKGFGNSDCNDPGHLFRFSKELLKATEDFAREKDVEIRPWKGL
jgi:Uri superfamily endonuclease